MIININIHRNIAIQCRSKSHAANISRELRKIFPIKCSSIFGRKIELPSCTLFLITKNDDARGLKFDQIILQQGENVNENLLRNLTRSKLPISLRIIYFENL